MIKLSYQDIDMIVRVISRAEKAAILCARMSLSDFLNANQQSTRAGMSLTTFCQVMTEGVLQAATNSGIDEAEAALVAFKTARA